LTPRSVKVVMPSSFLSWTWIISPWSMLPEFEVTASIGSRLSPIDSATRSML
jgi:hypothetical protein